MLDSYVLKLELIYQSIRQANQQAREVSPRISASKVSEIEADDGSVRMLIVRHPFSR